MTPPDRFGEQSGDQADGGPELTPAQERTVSELLGSLRHETQRIPDDVRDGLDEVLAGLVAERSDEPVEGPGEGAAAEGRGARRWPAVLVAAAAVSVLGVGIGTFLENSESSSGGGSGGQSGDVAGSATKERDSFQSESGKDLSQPAEENTRSGLTMLRSGSLTVDAQRLADLVLLTPTAVRDPAALPGRCDAPEVGRGDDVVAVRLDRRPATVVFRAEDDGVRRADVYACDDGVDPVSTTFVTAPPPVE